jgi:hypothetical protein
MNKDSYTITQINGIGFIVREQEWTDYEKNFNLDQFEAFYFCDKQETKEMSYLFYQIFVCEKSSLIWNEMYLSKPEEISIFRNETSLRALYHPYYEPLISFTKDYFQLNEYKECSYWSILTSFDIGKYNKNTNIEKNEFKNFDEFTNYFGYQ